MGSEPILASGVALAAGLLIAYPPPGSTSGLQPASGPPTLGVTQALRGTVAAEHLSVAEQAGPDIVAASVTPVSGGRRGVQVQTLDALEHPLAVPTRVLQATRTGACGLGCTRASLAGSPSALVVKVADHGNVFTAQLPIGFQPTSDRLAAQLLRQIETSELKLRSAVVHETLRSGTAVPDITTYELRARPTGSRSSSPATAGRSRTRSSLVARNGPAARASRNGKRTCTAVAARRSLPAATSGGGRRSPGIRGCSTATSSARALARTSRPSASSKASDRSGYAFA